MTFHPYGDHSGLHGHMYMNKIGPAICFDIFCYDFFVGFIVNDIVFDKLCASCVMICNAGLKKQTNFSLLIEFNLSIQTLNF